MSNSLFFKSVFLSSPFLVLSRLRKSYGEWFKGRIYITSHIWSYLLGTSVLLMEAFQILLFGRPIWQMLHFTFPWHDLVLSGCTSSPGVIFFILQLLMISHPLKWDVFRIFHVWQLLVFNGLREDAHILGYTSDRGAPCLCFNIHYFSWCYRLFKPTSYPLKFKGKESVSYSSNSKNLLSYIIF